MSEKTLAEGLHDENVLLSCRMQDARIKGKTFTAEEAAALHRERQYYITKERNDAGERMLERLKEEP